MAGRGSAPNEGPIGRERGLKMNKAILTAAALLAFLPAAGSAQAPAPPSDATIAEFVAAMPPAPPASRAADPEQLARLSSLNPGKAGAIESILTVYQGCILVVVEDHTKGIFRNLATALGEAKVRRLTQFYKSPEFPLFSILADKHESGQTLSAAEATRMDRFMTEYPIAEFGEKLLAANAAAASDQGLITKFTKCSLDKKTALIRAEVRLD
jgi:hypothetical protein